VAPEVQPYFKPFTPYCTSAISYYYYFYRKSSWETEKGKKNNERIKTYLKNNYYLFFKYTCWGKKTNNQYLKYINL